AFYTSTAPYWHPLTWLSHMLDCELFGLKAWGHHLTSLLLHVANTFLVFLVLRRMTGAFWRSWFVAGLFGLHPMHVESVAWVAERKDLLSTLFWLLTLWAYERYATSAKVQNRKPFYYGLALAFFALGLMSKPMLVTLPCVLLLMDYWPLGRTYESKDLRSDPQIKAPSAPLSPPDSRKPAPTFRCRWSYIVYRKLIWEKVPFFLLAA